VPTAYGMKRPVHGNAVPETGNEAFVSVRCASSGVTPSGWPPCAGGMYGERKQTWIFSDENCASAPEVWSTKSGTSSGWSLTVACSSQYALCVAVPVHSWASAAIDTGKFAGTVVGSATSNVPLADAWAPPDWRIATVAEPVPICVPAAWLRSVWTPGGT